MPTTTIITTTAMTSHILTSKCQIKQQALLHLELRVLQQMDGTVS